MNRPASLALTCLFISVFSIELDEPYLGGSGVCRAQSTPASPNNIDLTNKKKSNTIVRVELLTGQNGAGTATVDWGRTFEKIGFDLLIRRGKVGDKPDIIEKKQGPLRLVTAIGHLDSEGRIIFPDRSFSLDQSNQLTEWLRDLQTFGAQGSPRGKPLWGMNEDQFQQVFTILAEPFQVKDPIGQPLIKVVEAIELPETLPLRWTTAAQELLENAQPPLNALRDPTGVSIGTGLAFLLNEHGFGFHPRRTPTGTLELEIAPLHPDEQFWPVGWPPRGKPYSLVPHMYKPLPVELEEVPIEEVIQAVEERAEIRIFVDRHELAKEGIKLSEIEVSFPNKQTTWSLLLKAITNPHHMTREIRTDEAETPFVWITVLRPGKATP